MQNPERHVYCFDCKMVFRPLQFNNGAILPRAEKQFYYRAAVKLEITYIGEGPSANLKNEIYHSTKFLFLKVVVKDSLIRQRVVFTTVYLLGKQ